MCLHFLHSFFTKCEKRDFLRLLNVAHAISKTLAINCIYCTYSYCVSCSVRSTGASSVVWIWTKFEGTYPASLQSCCRHNKKHLKNVGPIRDCEPPHAHSPGVATGTVARRLRIDVHDDNENDNVWQRGPLWPHGMGPIRCLLQANCKIWYEGHSISSDKSS